MRKQKKQTFQYLTARCAPLSDIDQDSGSGVLASCEVVELGATAGIYLIAK